MKFTKTLLAASVAVAAVSANADWVNPAQNLAGLNPAPVWGLQNLKAIDYISNVNQIDLGSGTVQQTTKPGETGPTIDVFRYVAKEGSKVVYELKNKETKTSIGVFELNGGTLTQIGTAAEFELNTNYDLDKGGQLAVQIDDTIITGNEVKVVNGEHVLYGYAGTILSGEQKTIGNVVNPEGNNQPINTLIVDTDQEESTTKYVQTGIIGNTGTNGLNATDASQNIYGVSAKDGNNITLLTGNGIALANLAHGKLQADGSVLTTVAQQAGSTSVSKEAYHYDVNGKKLVQVVDQNADVADQWYEITSDKDLIAYTGEKPVEGTHFKTGTANFQTGITKNSSTKNTITNQNVTYSEKVAVVNGTNVNVSVTTPEGETESYDSKSTAQASSSYEQSVSTGIIGTVKQADSTTQNVYGVEVKKETTTIGEDGKEIKDSAKTTITADYVDSGDFRINGVSIVDNIKTSVDEAVGGATEAIDAKVAEVDVKIAEVDTRLTQFNATANRLNQRISDVEETAYRGIAIALAAQQQVPNIGAGQFAVFGGVGHYEGESAAALGLASVLADGRTSFSAALGTAGNGEVGGRVGMAYVFGGK